MQAPLIHIIDDDEAFSVAIKRLLTVSGYEVRQYMNAGDFLLAKLEEKPGCILLDFNMPGPNGLALQKALKEHANTLPIIFISGYGDIPTAVEAIKAGAVDFLTKPISQRELLRVIELAIDQHSQWDQRHQKIANYRRRYDSLTLREKEVFAQVVTGKLNKVIAADLHASERTIKAHRANLMNKMKAQSLAELVQIAMELEMLAAPLSANRAYG